MIADKIKSLRDRFPRKSLLGQFLRYLVTGGLAFVVDFGLFALCLYVCEWHYLLANLVGLVAGLVLNYTMSIVWVFTACERTLEKQKVAEFVLFALVGIAGVGINQLLMYLMVDGLSLNEMVSKMVAAVLVLMWNFGARKLLLFKKKKDV
ncbi:MULTISPECIES: GtrA family protein [unclassified Fibrobacter]|uniref:GtrA family protein n=1 Tax=unclassified Fibrobacter TaxID=2634177 RepID=UPI0025BBF234|nr:MULTISPECIES: GtrA family protein [unclassified Fibrobacter]